MQVEKHFAPNGGPSLVMTGRAYDFQMPYKRAVRASPQRNVTRNLGIAVWPRVVKVNAEGRKSIR